MTVSTPLPLSKPFIGGDQARELRALVARRSAATTSTTAANRHCQSIVVAGGKGGVGRSVIALNLAVALSQRGQRVAVLDACPHLGNIELLCGMNGYWNLSHVLQGSRRVEDVVHRGPGNIALISGASSLVHLSSMPDHNRIAVLQQLQSFEQSLDWLIVDAGGGSAEQTRQFAASARDVLIVTTPEVTAVAEAYSSIKSLFSSGSPRLGLLINQSESASQSQQILDRLQQAARSFLNCDLHRRGIVPKDTAVPTSVSQRNPFVVNFADSPASVALRQLSDRWVGKPTGQSCRSFFEELIPRPIHQDQQVAT